MRHREVKNSKVIIQCIRVCVAMAILFASTSFIFSNAEIGKGGNKIILKFKKWREYRNDFYFNILYTICMEIACSSPVSLIISIPFPKYKMKLRTHIQRLRMCVRAPSNHTQEKLRQRKQFIRNFSFDHQA